MALTNVYTRKVPAFFGLGGTTIDEFLLSNKQVKNLYIVANKILPRPKFKELDTLNELSQKPITQQFINNVGTYKYLLLDDILYLVNEDYTPIVVDNLPQKITLTQQLNNTLNNKLSLNYISSSLYGNGVYICIHNTKDLSAPYRSKFWERHILPYGSVGVHRKYDGVINNAVDYCGVYSIKSNNIIGDVSLILNNLYLPSGIISFELRLTTGRSITAFSIKELRGILNSNTELSQSLLDNNLLYSNNISNTEDEYTSYVVNKAVQVDNIDNKFFVFKATSFSNIDIPLINKDNLILDLSLTIGTSLTFSVNLPVENGETDDVVKQIISLPLAQQYLIPNISDYYGYYDYLSIAFLDHLTTKLKEAVNDTTYSSFSNSIAVTEISQIINNNEITVSYNLDFPVDLYGFITVIQETTESVIKELNIDNVIYNISGFLNSTVFDEEGVTGITLSFSIQRNPTSIIPYNYKDIYFTNNVSHIVVIEQDTNTSLSNHNSNFINLSIATYYDRSNNKLLLTGELYETPTSLTTKLNSSVVTLTLVSIKKRINQNNLIQPSTISINTDTDNLSDRGIPYQTSSVTPTHAYSVGGFIFLLPNTAKLGSVDGKNSLTNEEHSALAEYLSSDKLTTTILSGDGGDILDIKLYSTPKSFNWTIDNTLYQDSIAYLSKLFILKIHNNYKNIEDLPAYSINNTYVEVGTDKYYTAFRYKVDQETSSTLQIASGIWEECPFWDANTITEQNSIEHLMGIYREGSFNKNEKMGVTHRLVGNSSNNNPVFLQEDITIIDTLSIGGRLYILSSGGLDISSTKDYLTFFRSSLLTEFNNEEAFNISAPNKNYIGITVSNEHIYIFDSEGILYTNDTPDGRKELLRLHYISVHDNIKPISTNFGTLFVSSLSIHILNSNNQIEIPFNNLDTFNIKVLDIKGIVVYNTTNTIFLLTNDKIYYIVMNKRDDNTHLLWSQWELNYKTNDTTYEYISIAGDDLIITLKDNINNTYKSFVNNLSYKNNSNIQETVEHIIELPLPYNVLPSINNTSITETILNYTVWARLSAGDTIEVEFEDGAITVLADITSNTTDIIPYTCNIAPNVIKRVIVKLSGDLNTIIDTVELGLSNTNNYTRQ